MRKEFVFEHTMRGFYQWCRSISEIKRKMAEVIASEKIRGNDVPNFWGNIKSTYIKTKQIISLFNEAQKGYLQCYINHTLPTRDLYELANPFQMYDIWADIMFKDRGATIRPISKEEIGEAIKKARLFQNRTLVSAAKLCRISPNTLKAYESGKRMLPFDVFYKLNQFLDIKIKYL